MAKRKNGYSYGYGYGYGYGYKKDNSSLVKESYKTIRTNLLYALAGAEKKVIAISSPTPSEGKSTTSSNLAVTIAQTGNTVLLIDADLRKPTLHKLFRVTNDDGLSKVLSKQSQLADVIKKDVKPNLSLITSGPIPPNPSELLSMPIYEQTIEELSSQYDYVIIDTPPVNIVSDCQLIVRAVQGIVFVVRYKVSQYKELELAAENIRNIDGNILGVVINDVKERKGPLSRRYYRNYYSYVDGEN